MMRKREKLGMFRRRGEEGQVLILVVIAMAIFLIGFVGFAVDMTNMWFHRQMAQGAADAACQAGAMDLLFVTQNALDPRPVGFNPPGSTIDCFSSPSSPPCQYATLNGYTASAANQVMVRFSPTVAIPPGVEPAPGSYLGSTPALIRVDITDPVKLFFAPLITGRGSSDVHAQATCALVTSRAPIPIIILNPSCSRSLADTGSGKVTIIGGPSRSIQVNSNNPCASALSSSGCVTFLAHPVRFSLPCRVVRPEQCGYRPHPRWTQFQREHFRVLRRADRLGRWLLHRDPGDLVVASFAHSRPLCGFAGAWHTNITDIFELQWGRPPHGRPVGGHRGIFCLRPPRPLSKARLPRPNPTVQALSSWVVHFSNCN